METINCGFDKCKHSQFETVSSFRRHLLRTHALSGKSASYVFPLLGQDSFLHIFFENPAAKSIPDISIENSGPDTSLLYRETAQCDENIPKADKSIRECFIDSLGKLAFEYIYSKSSCKTNISAFYSKMVTTYATYLPQPDEMLFAEQVFRNDYRIKRFFEENFQLLKVIEADIDPGISLFYLDVYQFFIHFLSNPSIVSCLEFYSPKKPYMESVLDGKYFRNFQNRIHLLIYVDDFDPLVKSVYFGRSSHKVTGVYLKILNVSPNISSKRDMILPFCIFSTSEDKFKRTAYEYISTLLNKFIDEDFMLNGKKYIFQISVCSSDNLAAHELLGLSTPACSHPCRFCKETGRSLQENFYPITALLRNPDNMKIDSMTFQAMKPGNKSLNHINGVKEEPMFQSISGLSNPFRFPSCISHDIFEKIVPDILLSSLIRMKNDRLINLDQCVSKLMQFHLNSSDLQNPFSISANRFSGSSAQMRTLMRIFLFCLCTEIPLSHPLCKGIHLLLDIFLMANSPTFYTSWLKKFQKSVKELIYFVRVDLNLSIYPKLHYLIHYSEQIKLLGPLKAYSTDAFESLHKRFKSHLIPSSNHKSILKTMFNGISAEVSFRLKFPKDYDGLKKSSDYSSFDLEGLPKSKRKSFADKNVRSYCFIKFGSFVFKAGYFIAHKAEDSFFLFHKILKVLSVDDCAEEYLLVRSEKFIYDSAKGCYTHCREKARDEELISLYDAWHQPIEPYVADNIYLLPHFYYFE